MIIDSQNVTRMVHWGPLCNHSAVSKPDNWHWWNPQTFPDFTQLLCASVCISPQFYHMFRVVQPPQSRYRPIPSPQGESFVLTLYSVPTPTRPRLISTGNPTLFPVSKTLSFEIGFSPSAEGPWDPFKWWSVSVVWSFLFLSGTPWRECTWWRSFWWFAVFSY